MVPLVLSHRAGRRYAPGEAHTDIPHPGFQTAPRPAGRGQGTNYKRLVRARQPLVFADFSVPTQRRPRGARAPCRTTRGMPERTWLDVLVVGGFVLVPLVLVVVPIVLVVPVVFVVEVVLLVPPLL